MLRQLDIRYKLLITWIAAFLILWLIFYSSFQIDTFKYDLDMIIEGIENNNWKQAEDYKNKFSDLYFKKRYVIQMNNATEIYTTFEPAVRQLDIAVENRQESALEYAGFLLEAINLVVKPFSGP